MLYVVFLKLMEKKNNIYFPIYQHYILKEALSHSYCFLKI